MELATQWVSYPSHGESVQAYLAYPERVSTPLPGVVVIQEIWGPDDHIQDLVRRFATAGYVAMAPDLYSQGGGRPAHLQPERIEALKRFLDTLPPGTWHDRQLLASRLAQLPGDEGAQVEETFGALFSPQRDMQGYVRMLTAAVSWLRSHPRVQGRPVGSVGYCLGGALSALLAAADPQLGAAVIYYGTSPGAQEAQRIRCPVLGLYGGDDPRITDTVPPFAQAMEAAGKSFTYHVYPGAPHAFFNDTRASYHVEAARDAWAKTLSFFAQHLGGGSSAHS
jgi:carboxymethylenebutenolidase